MSTHLPERVVLAGLLSVVGSALGCNEAPVAPTPADPPPVIQGVSPAAGVTTGGTRVEITGTGFHFGSTVILDGVRVTTNFLSTVNRSGLVFIAPAHVTGPVDVVVINASGESRLPGGFTYAAPETFSFDGTWNGSADGPPEEGVNLSFTIENSVLVSIACGSEVMTPSSAPSARGGEFSFSQADGLSMTGRILSTSTARGEIKVPPCGPSWYATRQ